ncbi:MAG: nucleoside kinase, partial [Candidatus Cryptobacteroides sp.]
MVKVFCKNTGTFKEFQEGTTLLDALREFDLGETNTPSNPVLAAIVNNVVQGLRFRLYNNKDVEFVNYRSYSGRGVYTR